MLKLLEASAPGTGNPGPLHPDSALGFARAFTRDGALRPALLAPPLTPEAAELLRAWLPPVPALAGDEGPRRARPAAPLRLIPGGGWVSPNGCSGCYANHTSGGGYCRCHVLTEDKADAEPVLTPFPNPARPQQTGTAAAG